MFKLYGKNYTYNDGGGHNLPSYVYTLEDTTLMIVVDKNSVYRIGLGVPYE